MGCVTLPLTSPNLAPGISGGDGKVTAEEFGERFADIVKYMDSNGDGVLDESDMRRRHGGEGKGRMHDDD